MRAALPPGAIPIAERDFTEKEQETFKRLLFNIAAKLWPGASDEKAVFRSLGKVQGMLRRMEREGHVAYGRYSDRLFISTIEEDTAPAEERPYITTITSFNFAGEIDEEGQGTSRRITLPPNATPLLPTEFAQRFPLPFAGLVGHVAKKLSVPIGGATAVQSEEDVRLRLFQASAPGILQVLQFALVDGEPGVFTAPYKDLDPQQAMFCDTVVSYFDTRGQYDSQTGEAKGPELKTVQGYAEELVVEARRISDHMLAQLPGLDQQLREVRQLTEEARRKQLPAHVLAEGQQTIDRAAKARADAVRLQAEAAQLQRDLEVLNDLASLPEAIHMRLAETLAKVQVEVPKFIEFLVEVKRLHPEWTTVQQVESLIAGFETSFRVFALAEVLKSHPLAPDRENESGLRLAIAYAVDFLGISVDDFFNGFETWVQAHPGADTKDYYEALVPEERRAELSDGYEGFKKFVHRLHEMRPDEGWRKDANEKFPPASLDEWITEEYPDAIRIFSDELRVSKRIVREVLERWVNTGVIGFVRGGPKGAISGVIPNGWPVFVNRTERGLKDIFEKRFRMLSVERAADGQPIVRPHDEKTVAEYVNDATQRGLKVEKDGGEYRIKPGEHTYMRAIEAQYTALTDYTYAITKARNEGRTTIGAGGVKVETVGQIVETLKRADTFCWFEEPILAVQEAAKSLPTSVRLTRDLTEHYACWWYFTLPPHAVREDAVQALVWGWDDNDIWFTTLAYATDGILEGLLPSSRFRWTDGEPLEHALRRTRTEMQELASRGVDADETLKAVEALLRFFVAGCLWIQQTILVQSKGHIERHARKRMEKDPKGFNRPLSDVQIIQLRRRETVAPEKAANPQAREWSCRWVVKGFWRNQYYPSKGHYQPKWIDPFVKGPADKPLKVASHRVYAVSR